jgi:hypothetical protein
MNILKKSLAVALTGFLLVGLLSFPVLARDGSDDSVTQTTTTEHTNTESTSSSGTSTSEQAELNNQEFQVRQVEVEHESDTGIRKETESETEKETDDVIAELKKTEKEHSKEDRIKNCQTAESGLETKLSALSKNATAFQTKIDDTFAKVLVFQKVKNISATDFDKLVASAQTTQTQSASSIAALNALSSNLDCSSSTVAHSVAEFKVAAKQARTDLKAYKQAVKDIMKALEAAKEGN